MFTMREIATGGPAIRLSNNTHSDRNSKKLSVANLNQYFNKRQSLVFRNKETFGLFLKCISELQLRARSAIVVQSFLELFILDSHFEGIYMSFAKGIFEEIIGLVADVRLQVEQSGLLDEDSEQFKPEFDRKRVRAFTANEQKLFLYAKYVGID